MNPKTNEYNALQEALRMKEKLVAMLAPSFVIDFSYPEIIGMLRKLGCSYVVEVAWGAKTTNTQLMTLLKDNPEKRYIAGPCPTLVRYIKTAYPDLVPHLAKIDSPMSATAKLVRQTYPGYTPVFIGPCLVKHLEAKEDWPDLGIIAVTYKEIASLFSQAGIVPESIDKTFDKPYINTRLYPISGGLFQSSHLDTMLTKEEYLVASGKKAVDRALERFRTDMRIRLLDILFCDGGCINGKGIISSEPISSRRKKVVRHWQQETNVDYS